MFQLQAYTGWQLYQQELNEPLLKLGDAHIDKILEGGLRKGITEVSGEAGSGKTSFGMQLLFQCCLPISNGGLNAKSVYISTEGAPNEGRYIQLNKYYTKKYPNIDFGSNILMMQVKELNIQKKSLFDLLPKQAHLNNVKLIVLDSIATFYRLKTDYIERAKEMNRTCLHLTKLLTQHNMIVILINQVSDVFPNDSLFTTLCDGSVLSSGRKIKASLGLAWANIIDTRIMLSRSTSVYDIQSYDEENQEMCLKGSKHKIVRQFHIIFSPYLDKKWINLEINDEGLKGLTQQEMMTQKSDGKGAKHEVFQGISDNELQRMFNSESQRNDNEASSCSPTQVIRSMSSDAMEDEDGDIGIV